MRRASEIVQRVADQLNVAPQDFERALFMVGYNVSASLVAPYDARADRRSG